MSYDTDIADKVEDYLNGLLSDEEMVLLEQKIQTDPEFAAYVNQMRQVNETIHYSGLAELRNKVGHDLKDIPVSSGTASNWLIYGSLLLILGTSATIYWWPKKQIEESSTLYSKTTHKPKESNPLTSAVTEKKEGEQVVEKDIPITTNTDESEHAQNKNVKSTALNNSVSKDTSSQNSSVIKDNTIKKSAVNDEQTVLNEPVSCDKLFTVTTTPTCKNENDGTVTVYSDMSLDYTFSIKNKENTTGEFKQLSAGDYTINITYAECEQTEKATVAEKWCPTNKDFSFNPEYGEKWVLQHEENDKGTFSIYAGSGKLIFQGKFGAEKGYWDGTNQEGVLSPMGNYIAVISYADGRKEKVQLTIVK